MSRTITVPVTIERLHEQLMREMLDGVPMYDGDCGPPRGMSKLLEWGLAMVIPDPRGSVRRYYGLTTVGHAFAVQWRDEPKAEACQERRRPFMVP